MIVNEQKPIQLINTCGAKYDEETLKKAILWFASEPVIQKKKVYMHGKYPAITVRHHKLHIHRLMKAYLENGLQPGVYVHHKDGDLLNALVDNLEIMEVSEHQSLHNKGKIISEEHKEAIRESNRTRNKIYENKELLGGTDTGSIYAQGSTGSVGGNIR